MVALVLLGLAAAFLMGHSNTFAVDDVVFELEGDTIVGTDTFVATDEDADTIFAAYNTGTGVCDAAPTAALDCLFVHDEAQPDGTYFKGGDKDIQAIGDPTHGWGCTTPNNPLDKNNLLHGGAAAYAIPDGPDAGNEPDLGIYFFAERESNNGDADIGIWLLQDEVSCDPNGSGDFTGQHFDGDILLVSTFEIGGTEFRIDAYEWVDLDGNPATEDGCPGTRADILANGCNVHTRVPFATGITCAPGHMPESLCAVVNSPVITPAWPTETVDEREYFEGGINLSTFFGDSLPCISTFLVDTRTSQSVTAQLKDQLFGGFDTCSSITIVKDSDPANGTDFEFERDFGGNFSLDDSADSDSGADLPDSITFTNLFPGDYDVTEKIGDLSAWELDDIQCTSTVNGANVLYGNGSFDATFDSGDDTVRITLGFAEHVTCTFFNQQMPDITVSKSATNTPISAGEQASFDMTLTNLGPGPASGVTLSDTLPSVDGAWSLSGTDSASCSLTGNALSCSFGTVAESGTRSITLSAGTAFDDCGTVPNTVTVAATNEDPTKLANNSDSASIVVQCPNISVDKQGELEYTIVVSNSGPGKAFAVSIADDLPGGGLLSWSVVSPASGCSITGSYMLSCGPEAEVGSGGSLTVVVTASITADDCGSDVLLLENEATASASNHPDSSDSAVICEPSP